MNCAGSEIDITAEERVGPIVRRSGPFCICTGLVDYYNQRKELVAAKTLSGCVAGRARSARGPSRGFPVHRSATRATR